MVMGWILGESAACDFFSLSKARLFYFTILRCFWLRRSRMYIATNSHVKSSVGAASKLFQLLQIALVIPLQLAQRIAAELFQRASRQRERDHCLSGHSRRR